MLFNLNFKNFKSPKPFTHFDQSFSKWVDLYCSTFFTGVLKIKGIDTVIILPLGLQDFFISLVGEE